MLLMINLRDQWCFFKDSVSGDGVDEDTSSDAAFGIGVHGLGESGPGVEAFFNDGVGGVGAGMNNSVGSVASFNNSCFYRSGVHCVFNFNTLLNIIFYFLQGESSSFCLDLI